jgi:hypothetical protein
MNLLAAIILSCLPALASTPAMKIAQIASEAANEECARKFHSRPFSPERWPALRWGERWTWGRMDVAGPGGYSAEVVLDREGHVLEVKIYWAADPRSWDHDR